jgi:hypothetical protein
VEPGFAVIAIIRMRTRQKLTMHFVFRSLKLLVGMQI